MTELQTLEGLKTELEFKKRKQDISAIQQMIEPLAEAIEELTSVITEVKNSAVPVVPDYFDKELNKNLTGSIEKVAGAFQKFKQTINVDLSPITSIATEIQKQNQSIITLVNNLSKGNNSEELYRLITAMVGKNNAFLERAFMQVDYSSQLDKLNENVKKAVEWEGEVTERAYDGGVKKFKIKTIK